MLATNHLAVGTPDSAIALLEPIASNQKLALASRKNMFRIIGDAYLKLKQDDKAVVWYNKHITTGDAKTANMAYLVTFEHILEATIRKKRSSCFKNLKLFNRPISKCVNSLFDALIATGQEKKAVEEVNAALEVERDLALLLSGGKLLAKLKKYDNAIVLLEELRGLVPDDLDMLMLIACVKRDQGKGEEAVEIYKEINTYDPKYAPSLYERAEIHFDENKVKWAEMFYQRAIAADPNYALAEVGLGKFSCFSRTILQLKIFLQKHPPWPQMILRSARRLMQRVIRKRQLLLHQHLQPQLRLMVKIRKRIRSTGSNPVPFYRNKNIFSVFYSCKRFLQT